MKTNSIFSSVFLLATILLQSHLVTCCSYTENGVQKTFRCRVTEHCCYDSCCANVLSFYRLWYFWFFVFMVFLFCSGGGYYYRRHYVQQQIVMQPVDNGTTGGIARQLQSYIPGTRRVRRPQQPIAHVAPDGTIIYATAVEEQGAPPPSYESLHCPPPTYDQWVSPREGHDELTSDGNNKRFSPRGENERTFRATTMTTTLPPPYWTRPYMVTTAVTEESDASSGGLF